MKDLSKIFKNTVDSASNEIASNEFSDLKSWFLSPSIVISLLFMTGSKEILVLKSKILGPLELVRSEINCTLHAQSNVGICVSVPKAVSK